jgi:ribose transport system permease protein
MSAIALDIRRNRLMLSYLIVAVLLVLLAVAGGFLSDRFLTWRNIGNLLQQLIVLGMVSLGQTFVVLMGGIDLAIGSLVGALTVFLANFLEWRPDLVWLALPLALIAATGVGAINGLLTVVLRVHPLIVTLGMSSIIFGGTLMYRKEPGGSVPRAFADIAYARVGGIPLSAIVLVVIFALAGLWLQRTRTGRSIYFAGGDREAARRLCVVGPVCRHSGDFPDRANRRRRSAHRRRADAAVGDAGGGRGHYSGRGQGRRAWHVPRCAARHHAE